jgi:tripartite-type tricarboxylate transporter receptor subunit TctC
MIRFRFAARMLLWSGLLLLLVASAWAQTFPSRPIQLTLPYAPGGFIDFTGRVLAQKFGDALGQTVVPENRPGANGIIGVDYVARAAPDGYNIVMIDQAIVINSSLQKSIPYDVFRDLTTVSIVACSPMVLVVSPQLPVKTFAELIAYGKANPGKLNFASAGVGAASHLAGEMFKMRTGIDAVHVPYKGIGPSFIDLMSGKVQMAFSSIAGALPYTSKGSVFPIATTGLTRSPVYPDLPTIAEASLPAFNIDLWIGVYGSAGIPVDVLATLNSGIANALQDNQLKASFAKFGLTPRGTSVAEGAAFTKSEYEKWKKVIIDGDITLD